MAARQITATQTLEDFRTEFNALSADDFGDIATLDSNITATSVIGAVNELYASIAGSLSITMSDGSNTQAVANGQTMTFAGTANQLTPTVSATDTVTYALTNDVTIPGNFTASGTGTHTLGQISFASSTITSSGTTVTVDDNLTVSATKNLTIDKIESSTGDIFVGSGSDTNFQVLGFVYARDGVIIEGSTQDGFETTLNAVDPTADRTILLPNENGTIVTTGSSAVVTGTMIAADTVAEANMANDAIGQDQLKNVVTLQIINSGGTVVKTMYGAGA